VGRATFLPALLGLVSCTGSGSDVGPGFASVPATVLGGWVFAPNGNPVSSALVTVVGDPKSSASDPAGRFRLEGSPAGPQVLEVDGRRGGAVGTGSLGRLRVATTVVSGRQDLGAPIVLPDLDAGASRVVALGSLAGEADLDALGPGGSTYSLVLDPADGLHPAASVAFADPSAHPGETTVRLTIVSFPPGGLPLAANAPGIERTILAFVVDPPDVVFSPGASLRLPNVAGLPTGTALPLRRLDFDGGTWEVALAGGTVAPGGTSVEVWNGVSEGGPYAGIESAPAQTFAGRILDASGQPVEGAAVVAGDGSSGVTLEDGTFAFPGSEVPPDGPSVAVVPPSHFTAARSVASLAPGAAAVFGDLLLRTRAGGVARALVVFRGRALAGVRLGLGSASANFGVTCLSDEQGRCEVLGAPPGRYFASLAFRDEDHVLRASRPFSVAAGGGAAGARVFPAKTRFKARPLQGQIAVTVLREDSLAPIEDAFVMVGNDPTVGARIARTNAFGRAVLRKAGKLTATVTAGAVWTTREGDLPVGPMGGPVAERRLTVFRTVAGVDAAQMVLLLPALSPSTFSFGRSGRIEGSASGLTDPSVTPPSNPSGTYAVSLRTHGPGKEEDFWDVLGEGSLDDEIVPSGDDDVGYPGGGGSPDTAFAVGAPEGTSTLVGVERDSSDPLAGPMTRCGFRTAVPVQAGRAASADLPFDLVPSEAFAFSAPGLDPTSLPSLRATFAALVPGAGGAAALVRFGDATAGGIFDPSTGLGSILLPPNAGALAGASRLLRLDVSATVGAFVGAQTAYVRGTTAEGFFPAVPVASVPTAGGADFDPTGIGVAWIPPVGTRVQRLTVRRTELATEGALDVERGFAWDVFLQGGASTFVFPPLPAEVEGEPVPPFFATGATHELRLEALALGVPFPWDAFFASRDALRFSEFAPRGFSRFETTVAQP
jgi:hypothetical protein